MQNYCRIKQTYLPLKYYDLIYFRYFLWCQLSWIGWNWDVHGHLNSWYWYLQMTSLVNYVFNCAQNHDN